MKETKKLYDLDAYQTGFDAKVLTCEKKEDGYLVVLDQTLFFPEEGGQTPDKGKIQGADVLDVQIKDGIIFHTVKAPVTIGEMVHGVIDWKHRFNNMQQHSGEHIFSGLVHGKFGYDNVGFHLSDQIVTMDFNGVLTSEQAKSIESAANEAISKNLPVQVSYPSKEELAVLKYRSKIEIDGPVRIVTIPGVDVCACCAPHVRQTGEIGMLKIMNIQNYKGGVRISILCGFRALEDYRSRVNVISELTNMLSASQEILPDAVTKLKANIQECKMEVSKAKQDLIKAKLSGISKEQENVYLFVDGLDAKVMRNAVNELVGIHTGFCGIFNGNDTDGYRFNIGSREKDTNTVIQVLRDKFGARGGGNKEMVQGSVNAVKEKILEELEEK